MKLLLIFAMLMSGCGYIVQFVGVLLAAGMFFYGLYSTFAVSFIYGLIYIGGATLTAWIGPMVGGVLVGLGNGIAANVIDHTNLP